MKRRGAGRFIYLFFGFKTENHLLSRTKEEKKKRNRSQRQREGVRETHHSAISDEPDACCYADRSQGNGKRREPRAGRRGGEARTPAPIEFSSSPGSPRSPGGRPPPQRMECLAEDHGKEGRGAKERKGKGLVFTFLTCSFQTLHCLSVTVPLSSVCVCVCVCARLV